MKFKWISNAYWIEFLKKKNYLIKKKYDWRWENSEREKKHVTDREKLHFAKHFQDHRTHEISVRTRMPQK